MCGEAGHVWQRGCAWQKGEGGMRGRRDGHCSGRYASHWNSFLFKLALLAVMGSYAS